MIIARSCPLQVWMRVAGLPTFRKLYKRNDGDRMLSGRYSILVFDSEWLCVGLITLMPRFRLPGGHVPRHQVYCHLHGLLGGRALSVLGSGLHCYCSAVCAAWAHLYC